MRLSRAVLYALGVGTLSVTSTACGGRVGGERGESDGGVDDATSMAEAGPFTIDSALVEEAPINYAVPYGLMPAPPPPDEDVFVTTPPYGLMPVTPPPDEDGR